MKIVMVGAGRLATSLGISMHRVGHDILQVYSHTIESSEVLASMVDSVPICTIDAMRNDADVYIIALKDSVLPELIPLICDHACLKDDIRSSQRVILHTSGSTPMNLFESFATHYGVLYPMQTFSKERVLDFKDIPCFIEANDHVAFDVIHHLAGSVSNRVKQLSSEERKYLHMAAVFACNFSNHCYDLCAEILDQHGLSFDLMLPLIDETARKVHLLHPHQAQTGPAVRYDDNIINKHLEMLHNDSLSREIYELMSKSINLKMKQKNSH